MESKRVFFRGSGGFIFSWDIFSVGERDAVFTAQNLKDVCIVFFFVFFFCFFFEGIC